MKERRYSVSEIDRMRAALSDESYSIDGWVTNSHEVARFFESRRTRIEDQLRTYMIGGVGPEELEAKSEIAKAEQKKRDEDLARADMELRLVKEYGPRP